MLAMKEYHRPERIEEALKLLARNDYKTGVLAGGTNLGSLDYEDVDALVDLQKLGLNQITINSNQIEVGAMVRLQDLVLHEEIPPLVSLMAQRAGPNTFRNAGTIGGVIVQADWESELFAALLVHEASLMIQSIEGNKEVALADFSEESLNRGLVLSVTFAPAGTGGTARVARTPADKPIVAAVGRKKESGDILLAFCGMSDRPIVVNLEELAHMNPPSDFRGTSAYRREMAIALAKRVLNQLNSD